MMTIPRQISSSTGKRVKGPWKTGKFNRASQPELQDALQRMTNRQRHAWNKAGRPVSIKHAVFDGVMA